MGAFHIHILFCCDKINISSCELSLHVFAKGGGGRKNLNPCHALPLIIQTWGVVDIGVSWEAGTRSFSIVMKCLRESRKGPPGKCTRDDKRQMG
jgi:hypothetical protein